MLEATHNNTRNLIKCIPNFPRKSRKRMKFIISFNSFAFYGSDDGWGVDGVREGWKWNEKKCLFMTRTHFTNFSSSFLFAFQRLFFSALLSLSIASRLSRAPEYMCVWLWNGDGMADGSERMFSKGNKSLRPSITHLSEDNLLYFFSLLSVR